ncbi:MAG: ADP-ribosylglycohydrolase family protein [Solirubrobacteraceae bacterium]
MSVQEFRDDDQGYLQWIAAHQDSYVINIRAGLNPADARLHDASCRTIGGEIPHGAAWTGPYVKICAEKLGELEEWAIQHAGGPITLCGTCYPSRDPAEVKRLSRMGSRVPEVSPGRDIAAAATGREAQVRGPSSDRPLVEAWANDYVRFEHRPAWQEQLRAELRERVNRLEPAPGEVLHATFFGAKHSAADAENLLLYNIGSFPKAARFGLRFELGATGPDAPDGSVYPYGYRYELRPRGDGFACWQERRTLASFDWVQLGAFAAEKKLEQVWLALARTDVVVAATARARGALFSVRLEIRPARGRTAAPGALIKGIFDGVICAFQAQTDTSSLSELAARVASHVDATPEEIEKLLASEHKAVLGTVPRLLHAHGAGVQWAPADQDCVAGELTVSEPTSSTWAIKGEIVELQAGVSQALTMSQTQVISLDRDRFVGALLGLAVGDAVGTTVEFMSPGSFEPVKDMVGGGPFKLPAGAWTDDTSMALCLAESLVEKSGFDPIDQLQRYVAWYRTGHLSSTGTLVDIGNATRTALQRFERTGEAFPGDAQPEAAGNGALMRLAPVVLAYADEPATAVALAAEMARTTHGAPQAVDANRYFAALLVGALRGADVRQLLYDGIYEPAPRLWDAMPLHAEVLEVARGSSLAKEPPAIRGQGYVVRAMEAALWALRSTSTFEDGVLAAVNLGDDADTTAAIFGQLAGALYGAAAIPARWRERLVMGDLIEGLADGLYRLATEGRKPSPRTGKPAPASHGKQSRPALMPTPPPGDSFWVVPHRVLAGPYPGAADKREAAAKLKAFLATGVTCFIDLTEDGDGPPLLPLHPYEQLLAKLASQQGIRVVHLRMPIRDNSIPSSWQMRAILGAIREAVSEHELVYVHCWGGVGRTGTVIACLLVEDGLSPADALQRLKELRSGTTKAHRTAPETKGQRAFVADWRPAGGTPVLEGTTGREVRR